MFGALTETFSRIRSSLAFQKKLSESNIADAFREVRIALLDADVSYSIVKEFIRRVKEKALGESVLKSVEPGQQFVKIMHDELVILMGSIEPEIPLKGVVMLVGLQGCGKTTQAAKLAYFLKNKKNKKVLLVACDLQRPAAITQLKLLGAQAEVDVFFIEGESDPVVVAKKSLVYAEKNGTDVIILDTAGRLHIDEELMKELERIKEATKPQEILFVANAATGQDAVNVAEQFHKRVSMTGAILTMLDGSARAGAAISIREVTGVPLKFEGVGEKLGDLQLFNPQSMADRILGMGDTINLVKKAQEHMDEVEAKKLEEKLLKATFTYGDYLKQLQMVKKMGSLKSLLKMVPGMSQMGALDMSEDKFLTAEAVILSMTEKERQERDELSMSRRKRIAKGSGTALDEVNKIVKNFQQAKQFFKNMPSQKGLEKMLGGTKWR